MNRKRTDPRLSTGGLYYFLLYPADDSIPKEAGTAGYAR